MSEILVTPNVMKRVSDGFVAQLHDLCGVVTYEFARVVNVLVIACAGTHFFMHASHPSSLILFSTLVLFAMPSCGLRDWAPISFPSNCALITTGRDRDPCVIKLSQYAGQQITTIRRTDKEWCRLLTRQPRCSRPFSGINFFKTWDAAIKAAREKAIIEAQGESIENAELTVRQRRNEAKRSQESNPFITIEMPQLPESDATVSIEVTNQLRTYSFVYKVITIDWARKYIEKEVRDRPSE
jgi:hypothetical protein